MKRLFRDTVFVRLFGLVLACLIVSHVITTLLVTIFMGHAFLSPPPLGTMPPGVFFPPPPPHRPPPGLLILLVAQFIAVAVAAWFGAKLLARPMQDLAQAVSRLGDNLDSPPMVESGPIEAREAAWMFNRMQQRIRVQVEERGRFLASVSHDLRTPLTHMKLRVEQLTDGIDKGKLRDDIAEMTAMLDDTLSYLRGAAQTEPWQWLDIQSLVESIVEDAQENQQDVSVIGQAQPLLAQPAVLRRCLSNLIDNAVRYGQTALLTLNDAPDGLVIEVRDEVSEASSSGSSDDARISLMSSIVANFDEADTNSDGKVSNAEAMAFEKAQQQNNASGSAASNSANASSASSAQDEEAGVMKRIMQLMAS